MDCHSVVSVVRIFLFSCGLLGLFQCSPAQSASTSQSPKTWIVCVAGFNYYPYTYSFEAGAHKLCASLVGGNADNAIVITPDAAAFGIRNSIPGILVHGERYLTETSENYYSRINITYQSKDLTEDLFYAILSGDKAAVKGIGGEKVVQSGPQDTIILAFITAGDYGVMTLNNDEYLFAERIIPFLEDLKEKKKFKQMLILLEGVYAGSMFDGYLCTDCNIIALTNDDKRGGLCFSHYNSDVRAFTSTCFTNSLLEHLKQFSKNDGYEKTTLFDLYREVKKDADEVDSSSMLYGDLSMGDLLLSDLFNAKT